MRRNLIFSLLLLLPILSFAGDIPAAIGPDSPLPEVVNPVPLKQILTDDPIGELFQTGTTWYDYQHNGSTDRQIALDNLGNVHVVWMKGVQSGAADRHIYYNFITGGLVAFPGGVQISINRSGYTTLDIADNDIPYAFFHSSFDSTQSVCAWGTSYGSQSFLTSVIPMPTTNRGLTWPHGVIDNQGYIHAVMQTNANTDLYYTRSENGGTTFMTPIDITSTTGMAAVSQSMAASTVSNKVAIGFTMPVATTYTQEDVYYFESLNGTTWDFNNPINLTNFGQPGHPMTNTVRAWTTVNTMYDYDDNLHIAYTTINYPTNNDGAILWHWSEATGHRKIVGEQAFSGNVAHNTPGAWHACWDLPCMGIDTAGVLYVSWEQCTTPGDASAAGYGNWDVYVSYSEDDGENWMAPVNVTDTPTPGAPAGGCLSEGWPTLAERVDDYLHIAYVQDRDAGGIPQAEGAWTENPFIYQRVPVEDIMTDLSVTLTPVNPPITIPAGGGSFQFTVNIMNLSDNDVIMDAYLEAELPGGTMYSPILLRPGLLIPGGGSVTRIMTQNVPGGAPSGTYTYFLGIGDYGWNVWEMDSFPFVKLGDGGDSYDNNWTVEGWDNDKVNGNISSLTPSTIESFTISPNPFNPSTDIVYTLNGNSKIRLSVFDVTGRETAVLADGYENEGTHSVKFNAGNLTSGVYFIVLQTPEETEVYKSLLIK